MKRRCYCKEITHPDNSVSVHVARPFGEFDRLRGREVISGGVFNIRHWKFGGVVAVGQIHSQQFPRDGIRAVAAKTGGAEIHRGACRVIEDVQRVSRRYGHWLIKVERQCTNSGTIGIRGAVHVNAQQFRRLNSDRIDGHQKCLGIGPTVVVRDSDGNCVDAIVRVRVTPVD